MYFFVLLQNTLAADRSETSGPVMQINIEIGQFSWPRHVGGDTVSIW